MAEIDAYNEALKSGLYQRPSGLLGKYDNVRRFWEDEELGLYLQPYLERLIAKKREHSEGLRLLDLGCGSGDGFEFLTNISSKFSTLERDIKVIEPAVIELYKGVDINEGLLKQGQAIYGNRQNMDFVTANFNDFDFNDDESYDLYLANYGTLSHNTDEQTVDFLSKIVRKSRDGSLIVIDWLGRYSYEWQTLWTKDLEHNQCMNYAISYIHSGGKTKQQELTYFPLRIMGYKEVLHIYRQVKRKTKGAVTLCKLADRSSLVGRHMDTAQYNPYCQPMRRLVNSLFEPNVCTNLDEVLVIYIPRNGFIEVNAYYQRLADCWNYLTTYTKALLEGSKPPEELAEMPLPLRKTVSAMKGVVKAATRLKTGNARASLVEPQLGYCLRELEMRLQQGWGCGHGLAAIFEVVKK